MDQKKIVVADAGEEFRKLLTELMEKEEDLRVVGDTADGAELIELCRQRQPDVVVMDMILSTLDGVDALAQLGELVPKPRVLVLSSFAGGSIAELAAAQGADYFLMKPCRIAAVVERVRQIVSGPGSAGRRSGAAGAWRARSPPSSMRSGSRPISRATSISGRPS